MDTRRRFIQRAAIGAAGLALAPRLAMSCAHATGNGRNVLFIAIDDLRPQLRCYGHAMIHSPNIDRLASEGTLFRRAYCQQAVCNPSRASLMTGLRPDTARVWDLRTHFRDMNPDVVTLPQHFMNNGYHSQGMGNIYHTGHGNRDDALSWSVPHRSPRIGKYLAPVNKEILARNRTASRKRVEPGQPAGASNGPPTEMFDAPDNAYTDGATAELAVETLGNVKDNPFFLAVGFSKPHLPFCAPKKYLDLYDPADITLPDNTELPEGMPEFAATNWGELRTYDGVPAEGPLSEADARRLTHGYYACVSYVDAVVGHVVGELGRLGLRDNTTVALWGDHGWKLGEHGMWCKHTNFELDCRAPLIVSAPRVGAGSDTNALVEFVDLYPSLSELAGLPLPDHLEGISFVPLMEDPDRPWKAAAFSQYPRGRRIMGYSMKTDRWRYTEWVGRQDGAIVARELYDHVNDPGENVNVVGRGELEDTVDMLADMMKRGWRGGRHNLPTPSG